MEKVKKILMISTITVVFAIMPVFGAKKQGVTIYKQSDLVKQQVNIYTPAAYQSGNVVRSGLGMLGMSVAVVSDKRMVPVVVACYCSRNHNTC